MACCRGRLGLGNDTKHSGVASRLKSVKGLEISAFLSAIWHFAPTNVRNFGGLLDHVN